jgi:hypothetical protein
MLTHRLLFWPSDEVTIDFRELGQRFESTFSEHRSSIRQVNALVATLIRRRARDGAQPEMAPTAPTR